MLRVYHMACSIASHIVTYISSRMPSLAYFVFCSISHASFQTICEPAASISRAIRHIGECWHAICSRPRRSWHSRLPEITYGIEYVTRCSTTKGRRERGAWGVHA